MQQITHFGISVMEKRGFVLSKKLTRETEAPELYALPVRPIRCTYPATLSGISKFITCSSTRESIN